MDVVAAVLKGTGCAAEDVASGGFCEGCVVAVAEDLFA